MSFETIRVAIAEFLQTPILINQYVQLDFWSLVHVGSGFLIMFFILKKLKKHKHIIHNRYFLTFAILFGWELFEFTMYGVVKTSYFKPEEQIDLLWDLGVGTMGGFLADLLVRKKVL